MNFTGCEGFLAADPKVFWDEHGKIGSCYYTLVNNDRKCEKPDYISCIAYGKNAEIANHYFKKGTHVMMEGYLTTRPDKKGIYRMAVIVRKNKYLKNEKTKDSDPFQSEKGEENNFIKASKPAILTEPGFYDVHEGNFETEDFEEDYM